jgi:hypothetical protein
MPKKPPLTATQLKDFRVATNRVSLESINYAAEIVGYTDLVTATVAALETLIETGSADCQSLRVLNQKAANPTFLLSRTVSLDLSGSLLMTVPSHRASFAAFIGASCANISVDSGNASTDVNNRVSSFFHH